MKDTGTKDRSMFDYVVLDLSDIKSIMDAVKKFPHIDRICLNAGGLTSNTVHEKSGATTGIVSNVLGHSILTDELLKAGKVNITGGRIVYVGSEITRTLWAFAGLLPLCYWSFTKTDLDWAISKNYDGICSSCIPLRRQMGDYKNAKIIGQNFYAAVGKENPNIKVISVSPGAVGSSGMNGAYFPMNLMDSLIPCLFRCICVSHPFETGVQRYIDVLTPETIVWESGSMVLSGYGGCCCLWGAQGSVTDNREYAAYFRDEEVIMETAVKVREYQKKWIIAESSIVVPNNGQK